MPRVLDLFIIILFCPIIILLISIISILSLIFQGRGVFFKQDRIGMSEKIFKLYKFRTMIKDSQKTGTGLFSYSDDPRVTKFGKILRLSSLDEIPQLYNILIGDMSIVGPRPAVVGELDFEKNLPKNYKDRFKMKPGITGLAQINGRNNLNWSQKIEYDLKYINYPCFKRLLVSIYIIAYTPFYLLNFESIIEKNDK
tara:strand:- start:1205 stop:1795 length:591 start_codon:yes stop_codon:yes gene_type:complete